MTTKYLVDPVYSGTLCCTPYIRPLLYPVCSTVHLLVYPVYSTTPCIALHTLYTLVHSGLYTFVLPVPKIPHNYTLKPFHPTLKDGAS